MGEMPWVSIVTPSYNQGPFIEETILTVLNQDYPRIEYIVMDGGSTDNTLQILRKYEGRLKWVSEKDQGQSDAINKGFQRAKGEILAWLNSDDMYFTGAVRRAVEILQADTEIQFVYGKTRYCDETGKIIGEYPTEPFNYRRLAMFNFISQPSTFFKREVFLKAGGLNTDLQFAMDYDLWLRTVSRYKVEYLPEYLSIFRLHGKSKTISQTHALRFNEEILNTVRRYYKWAPANRVYAYCYHLVKCKAPGFVGRSLPVLVLLTCGISILYYFRLNKMIRLDDLRMITPKNLRILFSGSDGAPHLGE
jgi:glycosyltransferase involved in cell wall biosynthesis